MVSGLTQVLVIYQPFLANVYALPKTKKYNVPTMNKSIFPFRQLLRTWQYMTRTFNYFYQVFYVSLSKFHYYVVYVRECPFVRLMIDHKRLFTFILKQTKNLRSKSPPVFILSCTVLELIKDLIKNDQ